MNKQVSVSIRELIDTLSLSIHCFWVDKSFFRENYLSNKKIVYLLWTKTFYKTNIYDFLFNTIIIWSESCFFLEKLGFYLTWRFVYSNLPQILERKKCSLKISKIYFLLLSNCNQQSDTLKRDLKLFQCLTSSPKYLNETG